LDFERLFGHVVAGQILQGTSSTNQESSYFAQFREFTMLIPLLVPIRNLSGLRRLGEFAAAYMHLIASRKLVTPPAALTPSLSPTVSRINFKWAGYAPIGPNPVDVLTKAAPPSSEIRHASTIS